MNIFSLFEESFRNNRENNALYVDNRHYTYQELYDISDHIAGMIPPGYQGFAGVMAHRSVSAYAGVLGVLRSGNAYVPLNPKFPAERLANIIHQAEMDTIVVEAKYIHVFRKADEFLDKHLTIIIPDARDQDININSRHNVIYNQAAEAPVQKPGFNYAYMLFTSGSTGKPKGVPVSHKNVACYISNMNKQNHFKSSDRFSNTFDLSFDLSVHDMFVCWSNGAELYSIPENTLMAPGKFMRKHQLTCWFSVPTLAYTMDKFRMIKPNAFPHLRYSFFCGEPLPLSLAEKWQKAAPASIVKNIYGPTEATIGISSYTFGPDENKSLNGFLSIGKIFPNNTCKIMKPDHELLLSGCQVTDQYWNDADRTKIAFVESEGKTWYKTGDIIDQDQDGDLFFVGRKDQQVQIHGYRVEPGEIDFVISSFINNANVITFAQESNITTVLTTCINQQPENEQEQRRYILEHCRKRLPDYMVPVFILFLKEFPVNASGKIDRVRLVQWANEQIRNEE